VFAHSGRIRAIAASKLELRECVAFGIQPRERESTLVTRCAKWLQLYRSVLREIWAGQFTIWRADPESSMSIVEDDYLAGFF
jgi:hypothetical protein